MVSVNIEAKKTVDVMIEKADALNIAVETLENGATVLDCGVNVDGSFKAGELYTKVCLGGLADVGISIPGDLSEKFALPSVKIKTDSPSISTLGSQKAGWSVSVGDFFALGSGPARAIALKPAETYEEIGYEDKEADLGPRLRWSTWCHTCSSTPSMATPSKRAGSAASCSSRTRTARHTVFHASPS